MYRGQSLVVLKWTTEVSGTVEIVLIVAQVVKKGFRFVRDQGVPRLEILSRWVLRGLKWLM